MSGPAKTLLALYFTSVTVSIAGMETFSALLAVVGLIVLFRGRDFKDSLSLLKADFNFWLLGFWAIVTVELFIIPTVDPSHRFDVSGSLRWILLLYTTRVVCIEHFEFVKKYSKFFCGLILFISIYGVIQFQTGLDLIRSDSFGFGADFRRTRGFFGSVMSFSYVFGMIFFLFWARTLLTRSFSFKAIWPVLTTFVLGWALVGTYTRGLWLGLLAGVITTSFYIGRKVTLSVILGLVLTGVTAYSVSDNIRTRTHSFFDNSNVSNSDRIYLWRANWETFKEHPIIGVGFRQNSSHVERQYKKLGIESEFISHAHNNFLSVLTGTGLIGFIFFTGFSFVFLRAAHQLYFSADADDLFLRGTALGALGAQVCFHVGGLTESSFYDGETMHAFLSLMAVLYAAKYHAEKNGAVAA